MLLSPRSRAQEVIYERSEVVTVADLFDEYVQHVEFSGDVDDLYIVEVYEFSDVIFTGTKVISSLYCEGFDRSMQVWL